MDIQLRRRAIYTGLRPYLNDEALKDALILWQDEFVDKPTFAFTEFISTICKSKELRTQRTNILASLLKSLELPESALLADPFDRATQTMVISPQAQVTVKDNHVTDTIFELLFESLVKKLKESDEYGVRAYVIKHRATLKLDERRSGELNDWIDKKIGHLTLNYELSHFRQILNLVYVALCESQGPVKADQLLAIAIKEVMPEADKLDVNVHEFL